MRGRPPTPVADRALSKVRMDQDGDGHAGVPCWLWTGTINVHGYGMVRTDAQGTPNRLAHRVIYELLQGPIPAGLELDHLCRVRHCVNPMHLEPVTGAENVRRGISPAAVNAARTRCVNGHEFTPENTGLVKRPGGRVRRYCRECHRARWREWAARQREGR